MNREIILDALNESLEGFFYYNRKLDSSLKVGDIEESIRIGDITVEELCEVFSQYVKNKL